MSQVKITADSQGNIVCGGTTSTKDGKTYGFIRVEQTSTESQGGWLRTNKRSALIRGVKSELEAWVAQNNLRVGSVLPGRIRVDENTTPAYATMQPKRAGADGPVLKYNGENIYRHTEYCIPTSPGFANPDTTLQHDVEVVGATSGGVISPNAMIN